ncbi:MAG: thiamine pyrophosphate-binding protein [Ilumatobacteraceae bacterium]
MQRTGGEAAVAALEALGVEHVFGIVSVHNLPIVDALGRSTIEMIPVRHEQGAVHAADGYARATGRLGVALTSTGPGAANAMGGLIEAYHASSRVLMITGQSETRWLDKGRSTIHEFPRQLEMLRTVTRRSEQVLHRVDVFDTVADVARDVLSGRPRPGAVEIPIDLQYAKADDSAGSLRPPVRQAPDEASLLRAVDLLAAARRPLLWAGGGVVSGGAGGALIELAEALGAPVLTSVEGRGAIAEDHPLALGPNGDMAALDTVVAAADVVLAVGTRFQLGSNLQMGLSIPGRLIHIDADPGSIDRFHPVDLGIVADADLALRALLGSLPADRTPPEADYVERALAARRTIDTDGHAAMGADMRQVMADIAATIGRDDIVVKDSTVAGVVWANRLLPVLAPRTSMRPVSSSIGPGLPLAIGAAVGSGRRTVVIQGDGGFMLSIGELATAVQLGAPVVVCVFNDRGYGILRWIQDLMLQGRRAAVDLQTPDFAGVARSMGMAAWSVASSAEFGDAFRAACQLDGPALLDIDITGFEPMQIVPQAPSSRGRRVR